MRLRQLDLALQTLGEAIREVEGILEEMRAQHDPLAAHIFVSRREYAAMEDYSKNGHHTERFLHGSCKAAAELGFQGRLEDWEKLMTARPRR